MSVVGCKNSSIADAPSPILSYQNQGVAKLGIKKSEHAIAFTGGVAPGPTPAELPKRGEEPMRTGSIRIQVDDPAENLSKMSRIHFGKVYTVVHTLKAKALGRVHQDFQSLLFTQFQAVWALSSAAHPSQLGQLPDRFEAQEEEASSDSEESEESEESEGISESDRSEEGGNEFDEAEAVRENERLLDQMYNDVVSPERDGRGCPSWAKQSIEGLREINSKERAIGLALSLRDVFEDDVSAVGMKSLKREWLSSFAEGSSDPLKLQKNIGAFLEATNQLLTPQDASFKSDHLSLLVQDRTRRRTLRAVRIDMTTIGQLSQYVQALGKSDFSQRDGARKIILDVLATLGFSGAEKEERTLESLLIFLCPILALGLASHAGSHCHDFTRTIFNVEISGFYLDTVTGEESARFVKSTLACLDSYIGAPVWTLIHSMPDEVDERYSLLIGVEDFADLWGPVWAPVWAEKEPSDMTHVLNIQTEGGVIHHTKDPYLQKLANASEVPCHWSIDSEDADRFPTRYEPFPIHAQLLIGHPERDRSTSGWRPIDLVQVRAEQHSHTATHDLSSEESPRKPTPCLSINTGCELDIDNLPTSIGLQRIIHAAGTNRAGYQLDAMQFSLSGGKYISFSLNQTYKHRPAITLKTQLLFACRYPEQEILGWLQLLVGLQISVCTGNAQRVTLWEALKLAFGRSRHTDCCGHPVGSPFCVEECWRLQLSDYALERLNAFKDMSRRSPTPSQNDMDRLQESFLKAAIPGLIESLKYTGFNHGRLRALWPWAEVTSAIELPPEFKTWEPLLEDSVSSATFATMCADCLTSRFFDVQRKITVASECGKGMQVIPVLRTVISLVEAGLKSEHVKEGKDWIQGRKRSMPAVNCYVKVTENATLQIRSVDGPGQLAVLLSRWSSMLQRHMLRGLFVSDKVHGEAMGAISASRFLCAVCIRVEAKRSLLAGGRYLADP